MRRTRVITGVALVAALVAALAACDRGAPRLAAAGAQPSSMYYIGPQPGPDRALFRESNPFAGDRQAMAEGRRLFVWYNCAGCHGDHGGGGMGPSLRDSTWRYGGDAAHVFASIAEGRSNGMPAWGTKLPREQVWQLVAYIQSLRTPDEPQPPR
jgi:mono/diheme cytochrome c family protein